jgi:hypothetical protein
MRLVEVNIRVHRDGACLVGRIERGASRFEVYFDYQFAEAATLDACADALAAALLLPCMRAGEPLQVVPAISPLLSFSLPRIRDLFHAWWPRLPRIDIETTPQNAAALPTHHRAATFFSGGVDSFYSLLKHRRPGTLPQPLTHIIYMRGIENRLELAEGVEQTMEWVQKIARATGVQAIVGETNIRTSLQSPESNLHWERHYHGSALAAVALGLSQHLAYVCIPSAFSYNHLIAHGSSPLGDEMYSTERQRLLHDGAEVTRPQKVASILEWDRDLVLTHLRVCIDNRGGAFNCGRCYKCVRTAVALRALGVWDQARTFPDKATDHWEHIIGEDHLALTEENLQFAQERDAETALVAMLRAAVRRQRRREGAKTFVKNSALSPLMPLARHVHAMRHRR